MVTSKTKTIRAQASLEIVIVLTAMLIVTGFVIASLYTPDPQNTKRIAAQTYWQYADIGIVLQQQENNYLRLQLINNMQSSILITQIQIEQDEVSNTYATSVSMDPGDTAQVNVSHSFDSASFGELYEQDIVFTYTDLQYGGTKIFYGQAPLIGTVRN